MPRKNQSIKKDRPSIGPARRAQKSLPVRSPSQSRRRMVKFERQEREGKAEWTIRRHKLSGKVSGRETLPSSLERPQRANGRSSTCARQKNPKNTRRQRSNGARNAVSLTLTKTFTKKCHQFFAVKNENFWATKKTSRFSALAFFAFLAISFRNQVKLRNAQHSCGRKG